MTRSTKILAATVFSASCLLVCLASAALGRPTVGVTVKWPRLVTAGNAVDVWGRAAHARVGSRAVLDQRLASGHWSVIAVSRIREGQFELWWQPKASGNVTVRVVIVHDRSPLASIAGHVAVMPPPTPLPTIVHPAPVGTPVTRRTHQAGRERKSCRDTARNRRRRSTSRRRWLDFWRSLSLGRTAPGRL